MLDGFLEYAQNRTPGQLARDALDIFIVYYICYRALLVLRGTRAMQVGIGLGMVFLLYVMAQLLQLVTVLSIMSALITSIILVIVVVFQSDIRRGLQRVGSRAWFTSLTRAHESKVIDEVVDAATELARHRIGAIVAFEQDANLDEFVGVHKGHEIDAKVTRELLVSLFIPEGMNKLHDGAVIVRNLRIAKAGVFFPMPEGRVVDESFGSRHRAALGITEETDAVVVVVSEERGTISFCFNGNIASNLDGPKLRTMLETIFSPKVRKSKRRADAKRSTQTPAPPAVEQLTKPTEVEIDEDPRPLRPTSDADRTSITGLRTRATPAPEEEEDEAPSSRRTARESDPPAPLRPRAADEPPSSARPPRVSAVATPLRPILTGRPPETRRRSADAAQRASGAGVEDDDTPDTDTDRGNR
jgi:diadenylate cyclase